MPRLVFPPRPPAIPATSAPPQPFRISQLPPKAVEAVAGHLPLAQRIVFCQLQAQLRAQWLQRNTALVKEFLLTEGRRRGIGIFKDVISSYILRSIISKNMDSLSEDDQLEVLLNTPYLFTDKDRLERVIKLALSMRSDNTNQILAFCKIMSGYCLGNFGLFGGNIENQWRTDIDVNFDFAENAIRAANYDFDEILVFSAKFLDYISEVFGENNAGEINSDFFDPILLVAASERIIFDVNKDYLLKFKSRVYQLADVICACVPPELPINCSSKDKIDTSKSIKNLAVSRAIQKLNRTENYSDQDEKIRYLLGLEIKEIVDKNHVLIKRYQHSQLQECIIYHEVRASKEIVEELMDGVTLDDEEVDLLKSIIEKGYLNKSPVNFDMLSLLSKIRKNHPILPCFLLEVHVGENLNKILKLSEDILGENCMQLQDGVVFLMEMDEKIREYTVGYKKNEVIPGVADLLKKHLGRTDFDLSEWESLWCGNKSSPYRSIIFSKLDEMQMALDQKKIEQEKNTYTAIDYYFPKGQEARKDLPESDAVELAAHFSRKIPTEPARAVRLLTGGVLSAQKFIDKKPEALPQLRAVVRAAQARLRDGTFLAQMQDGKLSLATTLKLLQTWSDVLEGSLHQGGRASLLRQVHHMQDQLVTAVGGTPLIDRQKQATNTDMTLQAQALYSATLPRKPVIHSVFQSAPPLI
jgi:hypothetical protein